MKGLMLFIAQLVFFASYAQIDSFLSFEPPVFINEIHYDNQGGDDQEGVEIAALSGTDLACYKLYFVNGNNGQYYATLSLDTIVPESQCGMGFVFFYKPSIQNGSSSSGDAIALYNVCEDVVVQFLCYEGEVIAANGPISGEIATDIGVFQNSDPIGTSLQLQGSLDSTFYWMSDSSTYGHVNTQQNFCQQLVELSIIELDSSCVLSANENINLQIQNASFSNQIDSMIVFLQFNDNTLLTDTISQSLVAGGSDIHTFTETLDLSQAGDYYFEAWALINQTFYSDTILHDIVLINDDSIHIALDEQLVFCQGSDSVLLDAQVSGADAYVWDTGETTLQLMVLPSSDTIFQLIAQNFCYQDTATVVIDFVDPEINFVAVTLDGDTFYEDYEWSSIDNQEIIHLGSYSVSDEQFEIQLASLESFEAYTYFFESQADPQDTIFGYDATVILTDNNHGGISISGESESVETWVYLMATDFTGCSVIDSVMVMLEMVGVPENIIDTFNLYPNPAKDVFKIASMEDYIVYASLLVNLQGEVVKRFDPSLNTLPVDNVPSGTYFLQLYTNKGTITEKVVIIK